MAQKLRLVLISLMSFTSGQCYAASTTMTPASRAQDFVNSLGINTHVQYWNTAYKDEQGVIARLNYLGIKHVRETMPYLYGMPAYNDWTHCEEMLSLAGMKLLFTWPVGETSTGAQTTALDVQTILKNMDAYMEVYPGTSQIMGPNEPNSGFTYEGLVGETAAITLQRDIYTNVLADPHFKGIPVLNETFGSFYGPVQAGNMSSMLDDTTAGLYPGGSSPQSVQWYLTQIAQAPAPKKPLVITEGGYDTMPGQDTDGSQGVDVNVQAKYTLDLFLDTFSWGIQHTFIYELWDEMPDLDFKDHEQHFGVYYNDGTPKPAATAIHNLTTLLADSSSVAATFKPGSLALSIEGLSSSTARSLLLQRGDGTYDFVAWAEPPLWNTSTASELPQTANSSNVATIKLSQAYSNIDIYDPLSSTNASSHLTNTNSFVMQVTDHPIIAHIGLPVPLTCAGHPSGKSYSITTAVKGMRAATVAECPAGGNVPTITTTTTGYFCNDGNSIAGGTASSTADNGAPKCNSMLSLLH